MESVDDLNNFDYVVTEDDHLFALHGDRHSEERVIGFLGFRPDKDGDRVFNGTRMSKYPKEPNPEPGNDFYEESEVELGAYRFPAEKIVEVKRPENEEDSMRQGLGEYEEELYRIVTEEASEQGLDTCLMGSEMFGLSHDGSDLDVLITGHEPDIEQLYRQIEERVELEPDEVSDDKYRLFAEKRGVPREIIQHHMDTLRGKYFWTEHDVELDLIPSHPPGDWTDFYLPDLGEDGEDVRLTAQITDSGKSFYNPVRYRLESEDGSSLELVSYDYLWEGLDEGTEVVIHGELFPDADTIHLRKKGHFVAPTDLFG